VPRSDVGKQAENHSHIAAQILDLQAWLAAHGYGAGGMSILYGTDDPTDDIGNNLDWYINTGLNKKEFWQKQVGAWQLIMDGTPIAHGHAHGEISGLGGAALLGVGTATGTVAAGDDARLNRVTVVTNVAALRALTIATPIAITDGYYAAGDLGGAEYDWIAGDTTSDNGGTYIAPTAVLSGRWKLRHGGQLNARQFGAYGDGVHDDTVAIQTALDLQDPDDWGYSVWLPPGRYLITDTLILPYEGSKLIGSGQKVTKLDIPADFGGDYVIQMGDGGAGYIFDSQVKDLNIWGYSAPDDVIGLYSTQAQEQTGITRCNIEGLKSYGIYLNGTGIPVIYPARFVCDDVQIYGRAGHTHSFALNNATANIRYCSFVALETSSGSYAVYAVGESRLMIQTLHSERHDAAVYFDEKSGGYAHGVTLSNEGATGIAAVVLGFTSYPRPVSLHHISTAFLPAVKDLYSVYTSGLRIDQYLFGDYTTVPTAICQNGAMFQAYAPGVVALSARGTKWCSGDLVQFQRYSDGAVGFAVSMAGVPEFRISGGWLGGLWNSAHPIIGPQHLWWDGSSFRYKSSAPGSASDGTAIIADGDARLSDERVPTAAGIAAKTHSATAKDPLVDADELPIADSAATYGLKKTLWSTIKSSMAINAAQVTIPGGIGTPTYSSVQHWFNTTRSAGRISGGVVTAHSPADGTVDVSAMEGMIYTTDELGATLVYFKKAAVSGVSGLTDGVVNWIYLDYDGGNLTYRATATQSAIRQYDQFNIGRAFRSGNDVEAVTTGHSLYNKDRRCHNRLLTKYGFFDRASGAILSASGTGTRTLSVTAGTFYVANTQFTTDAIDTGVSGVFHTFYRSGASTWTESGDLTQVPNTQYNRLSDNSLQNLTANRYAVYWAFICPEGDLYLVYGQGDYTSTQAIAAAVPASLPPYCVNWAKLIGKIIIQKSAATFTAVETAFGNTFTQSAATWHPDLGGRSEADSHPIASITDGLSNALAENYMFVGNASGKAAAASAATVAALIGASLTPSQVPYASIWFWSD
jgi:hypothetical protein